MATDEERLLVRIEAQLRQFEKAMAQATGGADRAAKRIETRFRTMESRLGKIGQGLGRSLVAPFAALASIRGIQEAADGFTRIRNALAVAGVEAEAAGPIFERLFQAAQKNAAPVEALVELYGRASLVQKELGVSSEELMRFTEGVAAALRVSGKSAAESSGALLQLSQALGSGVVRAEEFNSILEGALPIAQAAARGLEEAGGSVAKLRQLVVDGKVSSEAFFRAFEAGQGTLEKLADATEITLGGAMTRLSNSFIRLIGGMNETTGTTRVLVGTMDGLGETFDEIGAAIDYLVGKFDNLRSAADPEMWERFSRLAFDLDLGLGADAEEIVEPLNEIEAAKEAIRSSGPVTAGDVVAGPAIEAEIDDINRRIDAAFGAVKEGEVKTVSLADFKAPSSTKQGSKKTPEQNFAQDIARIRERTAMLDIETAAVGRSTFEAERMLAVQNLLNEAKRAGLTITPALRAEIEREATAYATASAKLEETEQHYRELQEMQQFFGDAALDAFTALIPAIETGNDALDNFLNTLIKVVAQGLLLGQGPLAALFGGGPIGGGIGGLLGAIFGSSAASARAPALAAVPSGPRGAAAAPAGMVHVVFEEGPMLRPTIVRTSGGVTAQMIKANNRQLPGLLAGREGRGVGTMG